MVLTELVILIFVFLFFRMTSRHALFVFLFICSYAFITPHWGPKRWLKKKFNKLDSQIKEINSKTDRIDLNVQIIKDELGKIYFEDLILLIKNDYTFRICLG